MKITIERFQEGGHGASSKAAKYRVTYEQPPSPTNANWAYDVSWQTSLAGIITFIQGVTEKSGP
jgi:hypothetical protein